MPNIKCKAMIGLAQDVVGKQRENEGTDLAGFDAFHAGTLEIAEFLGQVKGAAISHGFVIG